jgi:hypothetical protein
LNFEVERIRNAFRSVDDYLHALIGFVCGWLAKCPFPVKLSSLTIFIVFMVYQSLESEEPIESYCDIVEFLVGFTLSLILFA